MDLIDRQTAIDAILHITNCKSVRELFEYNQLHHLTEMWSGGVNDAIDAVIGVDSAQFGTNLAEVGTDTISRQAEIDLTIGLSNDSVDFVRAGIKALPPAQPAPFGTIKDAGSEHPLSDGEIIPRLRVIQAQVGGSYAIDRAIELLTAQHIDADGTLWVTVPDIEQVTRVIVDENKSKFCRQFYMDAQPEQPNLSEAYANAVFTWLMSYQIQSAQLKGRYTPYEVIGWVLNDWRKEHDAERDT